MKLAVKLLKRSDLTFFEPQFRQVNAGNQKSLNLNRAVLVDTFYPALGELQHKAVIPVCLSIWGPDAAAEMRLSRSIAKEAKNWRLNGEFVYNPDSSPARFNDLKAGDLALIRFDGAAAPDAVTLVVVSASASADAGLHGRLAPLAGTSMRAVTAEEFLEALADTPPEHPARLLVWDAAELADLEDAAEGDPSAAARLSSRRKVSRDELAKALARAGETGLEGEALVAQWLAGQEGDGHVREWGWVASLDAISPFDFTATAADGTFMQIEVKTTTVAGPRPFHISIAELTSAAQSERYDLFRLSGWDGTGASLRIATNIGAWAVSLLQALKTLPPGVRPQSFLVDENQFSWSEPVRLIAMSEDEDDA